VRYPRKDLRASWVDGAALRNGQGITVVAKLAKSFGCLAIPKVLATFATAKCDTYSLDDTKRDDGAGESYLPAFVLALSASQLAVWTSAPYFTPFMLTHLKLSYGGFTVLICASLVAKVLCLPMLGQFCRQWLSIGHFG